MYCIDMIKDKTIPPPEHSQSGLRQHTHSQPTKSPRAARNESFQRPQRDAALRRFLTPLSPLSSESVQLISDKISLNDITSMYSLLAEGDPYYSNNLVPQYKTCL